jgi:hypothetical protein
MLGPSCFRAFIMYWVVVLKTIIVFSFFNVT